MAERIDPVNAAVMSTRMIAAGVVSQGRPRRAGSGWMLWAKSQNSDDATVASRDVWMACLFGEWLVRFRMRDGCPDDAAPSTRV